VSAGCCSFEGVIYIVGGRNLVDGYLDTMEAFYPHTNCWTLLASKPGNSTAYGRLVAHENNRRLYYIDGWNSSAVEDDIREYNPDDNTWDLTAAGYGTGRCHYGSVVVGNTIHVIGGGQSPTTISSTHKKYDLMLGAWTTLSALPEARGYVPAVACEQRAPDGGLPGSGWWIYAFGGELASGSNSDLLKYDTITDTWIKSSGKMVYPREMHDAVLVQNYETNQRHIMIAGGFNSGTSTNVTMTEMFDPDEFTFSGSLSDLDKSGGRKGLCLAQVEGVVYAIGGSSYSGTSDYNDMEMWPNWRETSEVKLENISGSRRTLEGAERVRVKRDTIAYVAGQLWGWGTWDGDIQDNHIVKVGED
jgi:hypothetical protein